MNPLMFLLNCLFEEFGEVTQINGKIVRFGIDSFKPSDPDKKTNRTKLVEELNDVKALIRLIEDYAKENPEFLPGLGDEEFIEKRIQKFLHFAKISMEKGLLDPKAPLPGEGDTSAPPADPTPAEPAPADPA